MGVRLSPSRSSRPLVKAAAEVYVCGGGGTGRDEKEKRDRLGEVGGKGWRGREAQEGGKDRRGSTVEA